MIEGVFNKNFSSNLMGRGKKREIFVVFGEIYPDEILVAVSLKNPVNLRMTTCYASMDFPPPSLKGESGGPAIMANSASEAVQMSVNSCVDVIASFFQTYFTEDRPVDYDVEYRQNWVIVEVDKTTKIYIRINRDNLELEAASDAFLAQHEAMVESESVGGATDAESGVSPGLTPHEDHDDPETHDILLEDDEEQEQEITDEEVERPAKSAKTSKVKAESKSKNKKTVH